MRLLYDRPRRPLRDRSTGIGEWQGAGGGAKRGTITGKGVLNNRISEYLMMRLSEIGVPTHFVRRLNMREQLIREVEIIPIEVVIRNHAAGSIAKRFKIEEGTPLPRS